METVIKDSILAADIPLSALFAGFKKQYFVVSIAGVTLCRLKFGIMVSYFSFMSKFEYLFINCGFKLDKIKSEKDYTRIKIREPFDIIRLISYIQTLCEKVIDTVASEDAIACCSRYVECSDAKKCLVVDRPDYPQIWRQYFSCYYKRNLRQGKIFYGKNKNI